MSVLRAITRALPPPQFVMLPSVGIDISDTSLKYVQFRPNHKGPDPLILDSWGDIDVSKDKKNLMCLRQRILTP